ncbi:carbohydrate kinase [Echinicola strongylocentroti]|uniref:Carbohydrate kinase n=1 Tax=Echinicola strongylocentroti TaxID=1795355 RepID=A0A2Z4IPT1_9BACT|nr:carbohydrate kinase [Echinicola strongylocentroti]AWW32303.1 carbohydrate kinase [Echinicola strongylocentroti]
MNKKAVIFGEMLWDCFPDKNLPGGAPMNVALHIQHLGIETTFISKTGHDQLGADLLSFVAKNGLDGTFIQEDNAHETSRVVVDNSDKENIKYEIVQPVAWDFMEWNEKMQQKVSEADVFVFGSLAARSEQSRNTLFKLLKTNTLKVLDINIRAPHYTTDLLQQLLNKAEVLKINDDELEILTESFGLPKGEKASIELLTKTFDLKMVCITKGAYGAMIFDGHDMHHHAGYKVAVEDTVGSGDAFLSGFIYQFLQGKQPAEILDFACALGALVATQKGGTPRYEAEQIQAIQKGS